jgi:very-short-patch-repair endonuclease
MLVKHYSKSKFCSRQCFGLYKTKRYKRHCRLCSKIFTVPKYRRWVKYCSRVCGNTSRRLKIIKVKCFTCNKTLIRYKTRKFKDAKNFYCNNICRNNRGKFCIAKKVIKYCTTCGKDIIRNKTDVNRKNRKGIKTYHCSRKCLFQYQHMLRSKGPNKSEQKLIKLLSRTNFKFVGNFKREIGGKFPDFIFEKQHKIIELFGEYWHRKKDEKKRIKHFKDFGYDCLVIWNKDLKYNVPFVEYLLYKFIRKSVS